MNGVYLETTLRWSLIGAYKCGEKDDPSRLARAPLPSLWVLKSPPEFPCGALGRTLFVFTSVLSEHLAIVLVDLPTSLFGGLEDIGGHPLQEIFMFLLAEFRDEDIDIDQKVALAIAIDRRQALTTEAKDLTRLGACGDIHTSLPADGGYFDRTALGSRSDRDEEVVDEVVAIADEVRIFFLVDDDLQVTWDTSSGCSVPLTLDAELHAFGYPSRDVEGDHFLTDLRTLTLTVGARLGDHFARTLTRGADGLRLHHTEDATLGGDDHT